MNACEVNFDGLVGPTHNYAGLSHGNIASGQNARQVANPRAAALQGLDKMRLLHGLGLRQAVLPPHERPHVETLRQAFGFSGSDGAVLDAAWRTNPNLVLATASASAMWTANAATVSPSADTADGRVHLTPANLVAMFHRAIEPPVTGRALRAIFRDDRHFAHHPPLPALPQLGDEGAANHGRLCADHGQAGVELFVHGRYAFAEGHPQPARFPARQTFEASSAIARRHGLAPARCVFAQQAPGLIDAGVFHNDVASVANGPVLFHYQDAFVDTPGVLAELKARLADQADLVAIEVPAARVPVGDMIASYLFNSQLLTRPDGGMLLLAPLESAETDSVRRFLEALTANGGPIDEVRYVDLRQSMRNGGGPACLRLRVVLTGAELAAVNPGVLIDEDRLSRLAAWVERHYRDRLAADDLRDPQLLDEVRTALDELSVLLGLGAIYDFQRG